MEDEKEVTASSICFQKLDRKREEIDGKYLEKDLRLGRWLFFLRLRKLDTADLKRGKMEQRGKFEETWLKTYGAKVRRRKEGTEPLVRR